MFAPTIPVDTWNNRLRSGAIEAAALLPVAGDVVGGTIELLWPEDRRSIWQLVEKQTEELIDRKILEHEIRERKNELAGLQDSLFQYYCADDGQRGSLLSSMLVNANTVGEKLTAESTNRKQLIPLATIHAQLHLGLLHEQFRHGKKFYGKDNPSWRYQLETGYRTYLTRLDAAYGEWWKWRRPKIKTRTFLTTYPIALPPFFAWKTHGEAQDELAHRRVYYEDSFNNNPSYYRDQVEGAGKLFRSEAIGAMANAMAPLLDLRVFLPPGSEDFVRQVERELKHLLKLATVWLGPYSPATLGVYGQGETTTEVEDKPGHVREIYIREYNSIDGIQFFYDGHDGHYVGDHGGAPHRLKLAEGEHFCGLRFRFSGGSEGLMCGVQVVYSSATKKGHQKTTKPLGNRSGWPGADAAAFMSPAYELGGGAFRQGGGPSGTSGTHVMALRFTHQPASEVPAEKLTAQQRQKIRRRICEGERPPVV